MIRGTRVKAVLNAVDTATGRRIDVGTRGIIIGPSGHYSGCYDIVWDVEGERTCPNAWHPHNFTIISALQLLAEEAE